MMNIAEKLSHLTGKANKDFVVNTIIMDMPNEYVQYAPVLSHVSLIIDGL